MRRPIPYLALLALLSPFDLSADELVPVGVARIDITPKYAVRLSGYGGRRAESADVAQSLWAKALAIGHDDQVAVLLTVDNLGVPEEMSVELARRIKVPRERIAVCSTHTHSAPMLTNVAPTLFSTPIPPEHQQNIDRYTRELADHLERVAAAALADRKPARLAWAKGQVPFARNRRTSGGPVDHDLPVLRVTDEAGGLRALLVNYACHCTTLGGEFNQLHGDWAGTAQELLERSHPGAVALVAIGCGADANPHPRGNVNLALQHGEAISHEVGRLLRGQWRPLLAPVATSFQYIDLPFDTLPTRAEWEARAKQGGPVGYHAQVQLHKLDAGQELPTKLKYPVQTWTFGDRLVMVFLAGEVVVDYSLRLKKEYDAERLWVNAYTNDAPGYIPSLRILREGGYEGGGAMIYYDRPTRFAANVEELIFTELRRQLPPAFKAPKDPNEFPPPKSPRDSHGSLKPRPGFRVELAASEPLVQSPVAIDWGPDGKLWVVEMFDYPTGIDGKFTPGGRVKFLNDLNGDGVFDHAVTLADDLPFPTGVMAWNKGVLVCAAPDVLYLEDSNGDGKADVRRVLLTGFVTENYQARVNGLTRGLDGWVYAANGLLGGKITNKIGEPRTIEIGGRDFRFRPDTGEMEPVSGLSQQGRDRDDWGNWFGCDNSNLLRHFPLPDHYLHRNPQFTPPTASVNVPVGDPDPNRLFPVSGILRRFNDFSHAGRVTSACGCTIYRDDLFGPEFVGNSFTCEPVHNVVTRRVLSPKGATFIGKRADDEQTSEFLASTDNWFRPVQARTGPDGALWIVDMYRFVIEHPRWIPPDRLAELDVRAGADRGRIYRVVPTGNAPRPVPRLDRLSSNELVQLLAGPNGPVRDLAQHLLIHRAARDVAPLLRELVRQGTPAGQVAALHTLNQLGQLELPELLAAVGDSHPAVRRQAVLLSEPHLLRSPPLLAAVLRLAEDKDAAVRFQAACSLGYVPAATGGRALAQLALRDRTDPYVVAAVLSSLTADNLPFAISELLREGEPADAGIFAQFMAVAPPLAGPQRCGEILATIARPRHDMVRPWQIVAASSLLDALERRNESVTMNEPMQLLLRIARDHATSDAVSDVHRAAAVGLLGRFGPDLNNDVRLLGQLLDARHPPRVQSAALARLAHLGHPETPTVLLGNWAALSPSMRPRILDTLLGRETWITALLDAVELGRVRPGDLDATRRQPLLTHREPAVRDRATTLFNTSLDTDRRKVIESYAAVRTMNGSVSTGAAVFAKSCAACHRVGDVGHAIGPDLASLTDRTIDGLLIAILDPNRALDGRYAAFMALTKRGQQHTGMLRSESAAAISLVAADAKTIDLLRTELEELTNTGKSLMPEGLEKDITPQQMADLIAYLQSLGRPPKTVAGNRPVLVRPGRDGILRLRAADCEIHGSEITFESEFQNIGMWHGENDHIAWTIAPLAPGRYRVEMTYACDNGSANNALLLHIGGERLGLRVKGTGQWSDYTDLAIGEVVLGEEVRRIVVRPGDSLRGALIDLKEIRLAPLK